MNDEPGQKPKKKSNDRPNIDRFTVSMPKGLGDIFGLLARASDLDKSKLFRRCVDAYMEAHGDRFTKPVQDTYWKFRNRYSDW
jgi:hypothetical protein